MSSDRKLVLIPEIDELSDRLDKMDATDYEREKYHPSLIQYAGQSKSPKGICLILALSMGEYTKSMGPTAASTYHFMLKNIAILYVDVLVTDPEMNSATKKKLADMLQTIGLQ